MKGKKKYIVPLLLAGVTTATGVVTTVNQAVTVEAASATYTNDTKVEGVEIKLVEGFEDKYQIGDTVTIQAEVVGASGANLEYKVTKNGKNVFGFIIGLIMKRTGGKANPVITSKILKEELDKI